VRSNDLGMGRNSLISGRSTRLIFLFLAAVFFLCQHDLFYSKRVSDNFSTTDDDIAAAVSEGSAPRRIALLSLGLFAIVDLIRHKGRGRLQIHGLLGWILIGFAAWAFLSLIWASDLALTFRRLMAFGVLCIAAAAIAKRFTLREIVLWTSFSSTLFLAIGVSAELILGTFRPLASGYRFAGTLHPNHQGINCALVLLSGLAAADLVKRRRTLFRACALLGFVFLILTGSRTAFGAVLLPVAMYLVMESSRRAKIATAYGLSIIFCVLLMAFGNTLPSHLKSVVMLGRDSSDVDSFNGRAGIWEEIANYVDQRPILGYGYGGFWTPAHISEISHEQNWGIPNSHSTYLDFLLTLGAVGLFAYSLSLFAGIGLALQLHRLTHYAAFAFLGALLIFCAGNGLLESALIDSPSLTFVSALALIHLAFRSSAVRTIREQRCFTEPLADLSS
jgi:exopolysaccharide production protein ExoQ